MIKQKANAVQQITTLSLSQLHFPEVAPDLILCDASVASPTQTALTNARVK